MISPNTSQILDDLKPSTAVPRAEPIKNFNFQSYTIIHIQERSTATNMKHAWEYDYEMFCAAVPVKDRTQAVPPVCLPKSNLLFVSGRTQIHCLQDKRLVFVVGVKQKDLLKTHKRVCGKQHADTNLAIENFNFQSYTIIHIQERSTATNMKHAFSQVPA